MKENKNEFERALERVLMECPISTSGALWEALGISRQAFHQAKRLGVMPKTWAQKLQSLYGVNAEWVLSGDGPVHMRDFHMQLSNRVYALQENAVAVMHDVSRYGVNTKEMKAAVLIDEAVKTIKDRLDERAFKDCPDLPKEERLRLYYRGAGAEPFDVPMPSTPESKRARLEPESLACRIAQMESAQRAIDPEATEEEILRVVIAALSQRLAKIGGAEGGGDAPTEPAQNAS